MVTEIVWSEGDFLQNVEKALAADSAVLVDLSGVARVNAAALATLATVAAAAEQKNVRLTLKGVNVDVYKVLKLMKLSSRFEFVN